MITDPRLAYLRLHGRDPKAYLTGKTVAERFHYDYSNDELGEVAERAHHLATEADEVHVVFNNNSRDFAHRRRRSGYAKGWANLPVVQSHENRQIFFDPAFIEEHTQDRTARHFRPCHEAG